MGRVRLEPARATDENMQVAIGADIRVRGWALCDNGAVAARAALRIGTAAPETIAYGAPRPDVAAFFARPEIVDCGFAAGLRAPDACGRFDVSLVLSRDDGSLEDVPLFSLEAIRGTPSVPARMVGDECAFAIDSIRAFPGDGSDTVSLPLGCVAIVSGTVRARDRRNVPAMVYGSVDDGEPRSAVGERSATDGTYRFVWRFLTADLAVGDHCFAFTSFSVDRSSYAVSGAFRFSVFDVKKPADVKASRRMPGELVRLGPGEPLAVGDTLFVRGWAVDLDFPDLAIDAFLRIDGEEAIAMECRQRRDDVADRLQLPQARYCGFVGTIETAALTAGLHRAELFLQKQSRARLCDTEAELLFELRPE